MMREKVRDLLMLSLLHSLPGKYEHHRHYHIRRPNSFQDYYVSRLVREQCQCFRTNRTREREPQKDSEYRDAKTACLTSLFFYP